MRERGPNERLRRAMAQAGYTIERLAEATQFHPKQVGRWVAEGVVPRRVGAKADVARLLDVDEDDIWPSAPSVEVEPPTVTAELVEVWAHRADVPKGRWWGLLEGAQRHIDLVAYSLSFLCEDHPWLPRLLGEKAAAGCRVRVVMGDPVSPHVRDRDGEEGLGGQLARRIVHELTSLRDDPQLAGVEIRTHRQNLTTAVFRADDRLFASTYLFGLPSWAAPVHHVRRLGQGAQFDALLGHIERIWRVATPVQTSWPAHDHRKGMVLAELGWNPS